MNISSNKPPESQGPNRHSQKPRSIQKTAFVDNKDKADQITGSHTTNQVDISNQGKIISDIVSAVSALPDFRYDKVRAIKQRVDDGTYIIDPSKVAAAIIQSI